MAERRTWDAIGAAAAPLTEVLGSRRPERPLRRLVERGLVHVSGFTPSDAAHLAGLQHSWSAEAARLGAELWCRRPQEPGWRGRLSPLDFAGAVIECVTRQTAGALISSAIEASGGPNVSRSEPLGSALIDRAASAHSNPDRLFDVAISLARPLVAIGAPVPSYYPSVARRLGTRLVVPAHHDVSNAVGAVAGGVFETIVVTITAPREDRFRVHSPRGVFDFNTLEKAAAHASEEARIAALARAQSAGAATAEVKVERQDTVIRNFGADLFIESKITAIATGRPRLG